MVLLFSLLLAGIGLLLSCWIVVPAPIFFLYRFRVGAPEVSPWLIIFNLIPLIISILRFNQSWWFSLILIFSGLSLILSIIPIIQIQDAELQFTAEMEAKLGKDYLNKISKELQEKMRPNAFILSDVFRGISDKEVRINRGIIFANPDNMELKLNLYRPLPIGNYPSLILLYRGAWKEGSPDDDDKFSCYMAAQGYSVIAIDYRHAPKYRFPKQLEDVKSAFNYIQNNAKDLEVDLHRICLMGRSSGAHLATLAAWDQPTINIKGLINYYGPVDLLQAYETPPFPDPINTRAILQDFLGGSSEELVDMYKKASPINYVKSNLPPTLLIYPRQDTIVEAKYGRQLYDKLLENQNTAVLLEIPWGEHAFDAIFSGISNQFALYYTERFLAWALRSDN